MQRKPSMAIRERSCIMTPDQKEQIHNLRQQGVGYKAIAKELLLTADTVKGYCKRHQLDGSVEVGFCLQCNKAIKQTKRGRVKKFCCDACRYQWWNENQDKHSPKDTAIYSYTCGHCGEQCSSYGNRKRKYCSHNCYIKSRFGEEEGEEGGTKKDEV